MQTLRRLSGAWMGSSGPADDVETSSQESSSRRRRHREDQDDRHHQHHSHRHRRDRKDYDRYPLGGNRPFGEPGASSPTTAVTKSTAKKSEGRNYSSSSSSSSGSGPKRSATVTRSSPSPDSPRLAQGIIIAEGRGRPGSDKSTPTITTTPPTPSPLEQARRRNTQPAHLKNIHPGSRPRTISEPPYPSTPPATMIEERKGYVAYNPAPPIDQIHPALRPGSPQPPADRSSSPQPPSPGPPRKTATVPIEIGTSGSIRQSKPLNHNSIVEDPYEFLRDFDTVFVVDDSASMDGGDLSRWRETCAALEAVATIATRYDHDGIDIHFLNQPERDSYNVRDPAAIRKLFSAVKPRGCTPTGRCLDEILRDYIDLYAASKRGERTSVKPLNIVVLTDGEPTDDPESVIVAAARQLERLNAPLHQVGIQFLQIGDEPGAREALEELDDALAGAYGIRDMVDTTRYSTEDGKITGSVVLKALLGGVNRRWDRKRAG